MRSLHIALCGVVLSLPAYGWQTIVPITDASAPGSPVQNSGKISLIEEPSGSRSTVASAEEDWTVKNASTKPVVAIVESLAIEYPSGHKSGRKAQYELFFYPDLMKSGEELSFSQNEPEIVRVGRLATGPVKPKCEVTALWIQYADGSTFGDKKYGESLLAGRRMTLEGLSHLRDVYTQKGPEQFEREVQKKVQPVVGDSYLDVYLEQLRSYYSQTNDVQGTYSKLKTWIDTAESRQHLLE
jgi:hypothetical protein